MKILHYSLGFPPFRTGGMTKFCTDLMQRQLHSGDAVGLLWPGAITGGKVRIKKHNKVNGVESMEIINPLPVPYDEGIAHISMFTKDKGYDCYRRLFMEWQPDVLHLHTLMGLHKSLIKAAKDVGAKVIFTAHDFFPLCPKVSMSHNGGVCDCARTCSDCPQCNTTALSPAKMALLQSPLYRKMKNRPAVAAMRKKHRDTYLKDRQPVADHKNTDNTPEDYMALRQYFISMLEMADVIHYNSTLTQSVYEKYYTHPRSVVLPVAHRHIKDNRAVKSFSENKLSITYMGPAGSGKGYYRLKSALDMLKDSGRDFVLNIFFHPEKAEDYMNINPRYSYDDIGSIMAATDILAAPSAAYDTFGFTVAEALSYGVPVVVSENVGAKDIIPPEGGIIVKAGDTQALYSALSALDSKKLLCMNRAAAENGYVFTLDILCEKMKEIYN